MTAGIFFPDRLDVTDLVELGVGVMLAISQWTHVDHTPPSAQIVHVYFRQLASQ